MRAGLRDRNDKIEGVNLAGKIIQIGGLIDLRIVQNCCAEPAFRSSDISLGVSVL